MMAKPGPARRPALQVVREGNPGHRTEDELEPGLVLPPEAPEEPDWSGPFPSKGGEAGRNGTTRRCRRVASEEWRRVVPVLDAQGLLAAVDRSVLHDYCVLWAQLDEANRDISRFGFWQQGERGTHKNPSVTAANQLRTQLKFYIGELGLSPVARDRLHPRSGTDDEGSPFD